MKNCLLALATLFITVTSFAQNDCFKKLEEAFAKRGSYTIADEMHRNVIVSFFGENGETQCITGKVRVENGTIVSVFLQFEDETYENYEKKFYNAKKQPPVIANGISEMIFTADGEKFRIVFIDKLKPKTKPYKPAALPSDL